MIENRIAKAYVDPCCGTYCVWIEATTGERFKVAYVDMSIDNAREIAEKHAKKIEKFFCRKGKV